ncbi:MAG: redoxin domain-containing protein [Ignavibacteriae bacterium]|nr:redoxin domain-containing protein [Ignavibacteriota bacterium]
MKKTVIIFLSLFLFISIQLFSIKISEVKSKENYNFSLYDYNKKLHNLTDYKNSKAIVLMFISTGCPVSNDYNKRMEEIYNTYKNKNVVFLGINSNKNESIEEIKEHAKENNLTFTILKDENNVVADLFEASLTPEIYVLDSSLSKVYHGRIDDSKNEKNVESKDLQNSIDEILANKEVSVKNTKAFGCSIKRVEK